MVDEYHTVMVPDPIKGRLIFVTSRQNWALLLIILILVTALCMAKNFVTNIRFIFIKITFSTSKGPFYLWRNIFGNLPQKTTKNIFDIVPPSFLPNMKNPCFWEDYELNGDPYANSPLCSRDWKKRSNTIHGVTLHIIRKHVTGLMLIWFVEMMEIQKDCDVYLISI